ncbi:nicotinate-nucleotide--dimethylbenzimidazole phosphoribosyltransferase [Tenacibaculum xiamenense]|uniref:nicotinate-nucleotide--dimethylbenzimidazole phosphoribosyltransferase n=1 Tax=Tenacibaculum xiamenense TaxID=1261553 RepID=UPI0038942295
MQTNITSVSKELESQIQEEINFKTKPIGALGSLENIALQIGLIQNTLTPQIKQPTILVFAGDHGIAKTNKVSPYPQEVTQQMVLNFLNGGAAINVFCKQNNIDLKVIDAGVNADFEDHPLLSKVKISKGTQDYSLSKAMTKEQCELALGKGRQLAREIFNGGCNVIGFGEMGIGNTSAASLLMSYFTKTPIENCVGRGTGLNDEGLNTKIKTLKEVYNFHTNDIKTPIDALIAFGGFEIVMMCGAMLEAASLKMTLLIDGFIVTSALLAANSIAPNILDYCIFCHTSGEQGHKKMLQFLNAKPLLNIGMRLGEGTGCALAFPLIEASVNFLNNMATFKSANVSEA